ncbi:unnamed protein product [Protopolystoma xenopodis]|uniref:Uncharacterized protein n=1 Tax=Protopolystoma xenopodis TaxID=117903 RepID=A0A3S4ZSF0_9PLAT|nr:unnamed protein product [Protopolystoma xenopodis]
MVFCSDDVRHMANEKSARIHRVRRAERRVPISTNLQRQLQGNPLQSPVEPTYEFLPLASSNEMKAIPR